MVYTCRRRGEAQKEEKEEEKERAGADRNTCGGKGAGKGENLKKYFDMTVEYFNNVLHIPLKIYLADEEAVEFLHLKESDDFVVTEQEDLKDYLYDGEAMRKLSGKKLHKKKNHLNAFLKEYEGRYEFRRLCCSDRDDVYGLFCSGWSGL